MGVEERCPPPQADPGPRGKPPSPQASPTVSSNAAGAQGSLSSACLTA